MFVITEKQEETKHSLNIKCLMGEFFLTTELAFASSYGCFTIRKTKRCREAVLTSAFKGTRENIHSLARGPHC